jgi:hypothetical protein
VQAGGRHIDHQEQRQAGLPAAAEVHQDNQQEDVEQQLAQQLLFKTRLPFAQHTPDRPGRQRVYQADDQETAKIVATQPGELIGEQGGKYEKHRQIQPKAVEMPQGTPEAFGIVRCRCGGHGSN